MTIQAHEYLLKNSIRRQFNLMMAETIMVCLLFGVAIGLAIGILISSPAHAATTTGTISATVSDPPAIIHDDGTVTAPVQPVVVVTDDGFRADYDRWR